MSLPETPQPLEKARADLKDAERRLLGLGADPTNEWLKMSVESLRDEVELFRQILERYDGQQLVLGRTP
jgi:hypothetical protein